MGIYRVKKHELQKIEALHAFSTPRLRPRLYGSLTECVHYITPITHNNFPPLQSLMNTIYPGDRTGVWILTARNNETCVISHIVFSKVVTFSEML